MAAPDTAPRRNPAALMMTVRRWHTYLGVFIAPSILFFALTGALQLFALHEAHGAYQPAAVIEKLGEVHKNQRFAAKPKRPGAPAAAKPVAAKAPEPEKAKPVTVQALKWLFLLVSAGLVASTVLGLWMALTSTRRRGLIRGLLAAGLVIPVLLVVLQG
ncbi:MAG: PepSY domain-containing protein [Pseudomonadota bacterium]